MAKVTQQYVTALLAANRDLNEAIEAAYADIVARLAAKTPVPIGYVMFYNAQVEQAIKNAVALSTITVNDLPLFTINKNVKPSDFVPFVRFSSKAETDGYASSVEEVSFVSSDVTADISAFTQPGVKPKELGSTPYFNPKFRGSWRGPASGGTETAKMTGYRLSSGNLLMQNFDQKGVKYRVAGGDLNGLGSVQSEAAEQVVKKVEKTFLNRIGVILGQDIGWKNIFHATLVAGGFYGVYKIADKFEDKSAVRRTEQGISVIERDRKIRMMGFDACRKELNPPDNSPGLKRCREENGLTAEDARKDTRAIASLAGGGWLSGIWWYLLLGSLALGGGYYIYRRIQADTDVGVRRASAEAEKRREEREARRDARKDRVARGVRTVTKKSAKKAG